MRSARRVFGPALGGRSGVRAAALGQRREAPGRRPDAPVVGVRARSFATERNQGAREDRGGGTHAAHAARQFPSQRRLSPVTLAIFCWFMPATFEVKRPPRVEKNATVRPSGAQAG